MKNATIKRFEFFLEKVSELAYGCIHLIGEDSAKEIIGAAQLLKEELQHERETKAKD